jgi:hypothetical protein
MAIWLAVLASGLGLLFGWLVGSLDLLGPWAGRMPGIAGCLAFLKCWVFWLAVSLSCCLASLFLFLPGWMAGLNDLLSLLALWPAGLLTALARLLSC